MTLREWVAFNEFENPEEQDVIRMYRVVEQRLPIPDRTILNRERNHARDGQISWRTVVNLLRAEDKRNRARGAAERPNNGPAIQAEVADPPAADQEQPRRRRLGARRARR